MPELQWHRFEEPVCRVSRGPFLGKYEFAFARRGRRSRRTRRCNWQGDDARNATERPFQEGQSPTKWSYGKLILWLVGISFVALIVYVRSVMSHPGPASSFPVTLYAVIFPVVLAALVAAVWRHNHSTYSREYAEWSRSFVCERCGTVSQHDLAQRCGCLTTCKSPVAQQGPSGAVAPLGRNSAWTVRCRGSDDAAFVRPKALNLNHRRDREQRLPDLKKIRSMASRR